MKPKEQIEEWASTSPRLLFQRKGKRATAIYKVLEFENRPRKYRYCNGRVANYIVGARCRNINTGNTLFIAYSDLRSMRRFTNLTGPGRLTVRTRRYGS